MRTRIHVAVTLVAIGAAVVVLAHALLGGVEPTEKDARLSPERAQTQQVKPRRLSNEVVSAQGGITLTLIATIPESCETVVVTGSHLLAARGSDVVIYDLATPASPTEIGRYVSSEHITGLGVEGDLVVMSDAAPELRVLDISNPVTPTLSSTLTLPTKKVRGVRVRDGHAYVLESRDRSKPTGLRIVDVHTPTLPVEVGLYAETTLDIHDAVVDSEIVYGAYFDSRGIGELKMLYVGDPAQPFFLSNFVPDSAVTQVAVSGDIAYVSTSGFTDGTAWIRAVDVSGIPEPVEVGSYELVGDASLDEKAASVVSDLLVHGDELIFSEIRPAPIVRVGRLGEEYFLRLLDVSDPASPQQLTEAQVQSPLRNLARSGDYVYAAARDAGLKIYAIQR